MKMNFYLEVYNTHIFSEIRVKTTESLDQHVCFVDGVISVKDAELLVKKLNETRDEEKFSFQ